MKSSRGSDEIFGVPPQMKLNPPYFSPREAGFHREAISSTAGGFHPPKADLVEKSTSALQMCFFLEAPPGIGPGMKVLQTSALPLGYGAVQLGKGRGILLIPYYIQKH